MQNVIEILVVNVKEGTAKATGNPFKICEAHCVLRDESGTPGAVGVWTVPKALEAVARPGLYTCSFGLDSPAYGDQKGKVVVSITGLVPIPPARRQAAVPVAV
jgi:hypothetical protein